MSEICHCMHEASKVRCSHKDFCERITELEATITELTAENVMLKDFEKRRVYASPERWKQLQGYEATITELQGLVREHLHAPDNQKIREWEDLAKRSKAALKEKTDE